MKHQLCIIKQNKQLAEGVFEMRLGGDFAGTRSGQFVNITVPGLYLRRPISVCDASEDELTLIYKVVGRGTESLSGSKPGGSLDVLTHLGNGYDLSHAGEKPLLLGGGVGVPPLYMLAKELIGLGKDVTVILGFNTKSEIFYAEEFASLGAKVIVTTVDGSEGVRGFVTDAMKDIDYSYFFTCGPLPMLKAVYAQSTTDGQFSLEERMGCGFGACMGCSIMTKGGAKRVCKDGPVFSKTDLSGFFGCEAAEKTIR